MSAVLSPASPASWDQTRAQLTPYLRSLWNIAPALLETPPADVPPRPFLSRLGVHMPNAQAAPHTPAWYQAAAAHAAAHLVFSNHRFRVDGLPPITQALVGLLEDARVEWLACRELPGLRRLWSTFHVAGDEPDPGFEGLMQRLARCLLDPLHADQHPWVAKGRRLFFVDEAGEVLALRQPDALRAAAALLGNDIGQMRLQFNPRQYVVAPSYRDDNSWLWENHLRQPDAMHEVSTALDDDASLPRPPETSSPPSLDEPVTAQRRYREWDRQVPTYRHDWCSVIERRAARADGATTSGLVDEHAALIQRLQRESQRPQAATRVRLTRQLDGDAFDLDALVQAWVDRRSGTATEARVHAQTRRADKPATTLLLLDTSASTAQPAGDSGRSVLATARLAALLCGTALQRAGRACAIHAFSSEGRHAVHYERIKDFDAPFDDAGVARLMGLRSRFSTRLGAALRHATHLLSAQKTPRRRILLITDGEPHDIDIHDPRYLAEDARQAVREAARRGIGVFCLGLTQAAQQSARLIFGRHGYRTMTDIARLPATLTQAALRL